MRSTAHNSSDLGHKLPVLAAIPQPNLKVLREDFTPARINVGSIAIRLEPSEHGIDIFDHPKHRFSQECPSLWHCSSSCQLFAGSSLPTE